jgi:hypothetical protein
MFPDDKQNIKDQAAPAEPTPTSPPEQTAPTTGETPAPATPANDAAPATVLSAAPVPPKKKKTKLIVMLSVLGAVVLAGIGFAIWFFAYMNSDAKILSDALDKFLTTEEMAIEGKTDIELSTSDTQISGTFKSVNGKDVSMVDFDGTISNGSQKLSLGIAAATDRNGNLYVQVRDLDDLLDSFGLSASDAGVDISKISDQWIRLSDKTMDKLLDAMPTNDTDNPDFDKMMTCGQDISDKLVNDKTYRGQFTDVLKQTPFLTATRVDSEDVDGQAAIKYDLVIAGDEAEAFGDQVMETDFVKDYKECMSETSSDYLDEITSDADNVDVSNDSDGNVTISFWVSKSDHAPLRLLVEADDDSGQATIDLSAKFRDFDAPKLPDNYKEFDEVFQDLTGFSLDDYIDLFTQYQSYSDLEI